VFDLLVRGLSNTEICRSLTISDATAKTHVARILAKLGLATGCRWSSTPTSRAW
jgi:DNA-binding NarL/FixJ family response regulator